ncbi:hypothetical protein [Cohnella thailandensis]|uniref:Uncharacterized protein n=1 Tax=Cohnella thailandensis TaxID=557557 RepID=A0A841SYJ0_9BACL|nr:hypothetical protein [Cohnella thailandensis]MBB6635686.1 hypothetical protein [Cohnella thailandensis]MBP1976061.1 hypothetical protein [Cohnella thailandensis]
MLEQFIRQTVALLKYSDVRLRLVETRQVSFNDEEEGTTVYISGSDHFGGSRLEDSTIVQIMLFFGILDAKVDLNFPMLEGKNFTEKYRSLPLNTDEKIIFSQAYRIMRILRNNAIHSMSSTKIENEVIISDGRDKMEITKTGYEILYSLIYQLSVCSSSNKNMFNGLIRSYYDDLIHEIRLLEDKEQAGGLVSFSNGIRLKRFVRYEVMNAEYFVQDSELILKKLYVLPEEFYNWCGIDYQIEFNGSRYLVPIEDMLDRSKVKIAKLEDWII